MWRTEIEAGIPLALKLKQALNPKDEWTPTLALVVGHNMHEFKKKAKVYFPGMTNVEMLKELGSWSLLDIKELWEKEGTKT